MHLFIFVNIPDGVWQFVHEAENREQEEEWVKKQN